MLHKPGLVMQSDLDHKRKILELYFIGTFIGFIRINVHRTIIHV